MSARGTDRLQRIAALHSEHDAQLQALVRRRAGAPPATAADACAYAWAQLLAAEHIDVNLPWQPLAWLTRTAMREAWRLNALRPRATPVTDNTPNSRDDTLSGCAEPAQPRARVDVVDANTAIGRALDVASERAATDAAPAVMAFAGVDAGSPAARHAAADAMATAPDTPSQSATDA